MKTIPEVILRVCQAIPYPGQIRDMETEGDSAIRFKWRSQHFRVSKNLSVETVGDGVLIGDDASILLRALLKTAP